MELQKMSNGHHDLSPSRIPENGFDALENLTDGDNFLPHKSNGMTETQFTDFEGKTSFRMSIFNLSNAIMGSGILGLAYAMANTGIILFVILLILIAILSAYSIHLLLKTAGVVGISAYEQLGSRAFGPQGKILAACIITLHNIRAMSSYLFIEKIELPQIIQGLMELPDNSTYLIIIISIIIILPLVFMKRLDLRSETAVQCAIVESSSKLPKPTKARRRSLETLPPLIPSYSGPLADDLQCSSDLSKCIH